MKIFTKKNILICILSAIFCLCMIFAFGQVSSNSTDVHAQELITSEEIADTYAYGVEFTAPNGKIVYDGKEIDAETVYIKFPDGTMKSGKNYVLSAIGEYTVVYVATYEGKTLTAEKTFKVNEKAYVVSSSASSVEYVQDLKTTGTEGDSGLKISLAEGDSFQYNELIDVSGSNTDTPLIKIYPYSRSLLAENIAIESYYTVIRLTDYYNPEKYVEISMGFYVANSATGRLHPYVVAGASNQMKSGLQPYSGTDTSRKLVYIDNTQYRVYFGTNDYGTTMDATPDKEVNGIKVNNFDNYGMSVYYEAATKRVYVRQKTMHFITDLDDATIYDRNLFEGFTTGEVLLSVYANDYQTSTATYEIEEINGVKGTDLNNFEIADITKPEITLSNDADNFYIAKGEEFTLFSANAKDKNLVGNVNAYVYYEYGSSYQTSVYVKDGKFTPNRNGEYTIVYIAKDSFGNETKKTVTCTCISAENNRLVHFDTMPITNVNAGETTVLNDYTLTSVNKGAFVNTYAVFEGDSSAKLAIDAETREFFPRNVGEYEIVFEYGDVIKTYTYSYKINVSTSDNVYMDEPLLPKYLIKDAKYSFEPVCAETYTEKNPVLVTPKVYVNEDGKGYSASEIDYGNYTVNATESVQFKYVYNDVTVLESATINVVDVGFADTLHLENYFVGNFEKVAYADYVRLTSTEKSGETTAEFVNAISFSQFALNFSIPKEYSSFKALDIVLTDYYDYDKTLTIRYEKTDSGMAFSVNGESAVSGSTAFAGTTHQLWYDETALSFADASGNSYEIENPFSSDKVYLSLKLIGIIGDCALDVYKIGSQFINADGYDWVNSTVYVRDAISGIIDFGQTLTFKPAEITDVLTPYIQSAYSFYILGPDDEYVLSNENVLLDGSQPLDKAYTVTFAGYGMYRAVYAYKDQFDNPAENVIVLYVNDRIAPEITLDKGYDSSTIVNGKVGNKITVVGYTVSDNFGDENISVVIRVISPDNELVALEDRSFTADKKGFWKVMYYATDEEGNYTLVYYTVNVG